MATVSCLHCGTNNAFEKMDDTQRCSSCGKGLPNGEPAARSKGGAAAKMSLALVLVLPTALCYCGAFLAAHTNDGWLLRLFLLLGAAVFGFAANALWTTSATLSPSGVRPRKAPLGLLALLSSLALYVLVVGASTDAQQAKSDRETKEMMRQLDRDIEKMRRNLR